MPQLAKEIGSRLSARFQGSCIKHRMGCASVKIKISRARMLRIETTTNDVSFFKHHRKAEHKNGIETRELAPLKKSIYRLIDLWEILLSCNRRYLEYIWHDQARTWHLSLLPDQTWQRRNRSLCSCNRI